MSVFDCLQPIRHFLDHFVDEFFADLRPPFSYQILQCRIIPVRVFSSVHFVNYPAILNDRQVRRLCTVEITLKTIFSFYICTGFFLFGP